MALELRAVESKKDLETFLHMPWTLGMKTDPLWVPPLLDDYRRLLDPKKSAYLKHGEAQCFLALQESAPVGRVSVQIDADFDKQWPEEKGVAFFGFFDCKDDAQVSSRLFDAAGEWARARDRTRLRGPMTLDSKGEIGVLIDGFDTPPRIGMPHNRPYVGPLLEATGFAKIKDLFCWWFTAGQIDERTRRGAEHTLPLPGGRVRPMDLSHFRRAATIVRAISNESWAKNWGFTPLTPQEVGTMATAHTRFV